MYMFKKENSIATIHNWQWIVAMVLQRGYDISWGKLFKGKQTLREIIFFPDGCF